MNPRTPVSKKLSFILITSGLALLAAWMMGMHFMPLRTQNVRWAEPAILHLGLHSQVFETYTKAWLRVQSRVNQFRHADEQNLKLRMENTHLKLGLEGLQLRCHSQRGGKLTRGIELKLSRETGSKVGRTLDSIRYKTPAHLVPSQLYTLAVSYLKAREDEKAAVLLSHLTTLEEIDTYKTSKNYLLTGLAWYRVENYSMADFYLDQALKKSENPDSIQSQAQARLWKAMIAQRLNKNMKSQYWLRELVDHHPHSQEATWVNIRESSR